MKAFHEIIEDSTGAPDCNEPGAVFKPEYMRPIGRIISTFRNFWSGIIGGNSSSTIIRAYMSTRNGLHAVYPAASVGPDFNGAKRPWYIRASSLPGTTVFSPPYADAMTGEKVVTLSRTVSLANGRMIGVAAVDIRYADMVDILANATDHRCNKKDNVECFLLDKYGYVFCDSNDVEYPENTFFGSVRGPLASDLVARGILCPKTVLTPYGVCPPDDDDDNDNDEVNNNNDGECIGNEHFYEFDVDALGVGVNISGTILTNCMQGEYYAAAVEGTNLFFVMFQGPVTECSPSLQITPEFEPIKDYWAKAGSTPVERYGKACTELEDHECVLSCPGNNDPVQDKVVTICGDRGDCFNGICFCDPEYEVDDTLDCTLINVSARFAPMTVTVTAAFLCYYLLFLLFSFN